ncbi:MAG: hypothetical protein JXB49_25080 [Bacteroidales bacterium]|nr:hypothetical protein [Bacteroidales bacterium]
MNGYFVRLSKKLLGFNKTLFFFILVAVNTGVFVANNQFVLTRELYHNTYIERLGAERIDMIFEEGRKWQLLSAFFIPLVLLIKISFTSVCLFTGLNFKGIFASYNEIFNIALKAESVFCLANVVKVAVLLFLKRTEVFEDLNYYPLSLINLTGTAGIYKWLVYALQTLNLFELFYWLLLAKGLEVSLSRDYGSMLLLVLSTYVIGLVLWIMVVMLLVMNIS